jgi:hypothetical protein
MASYVFVWSKNRTDIRDGNEYKIWKWLVLKFHDSGHLQIILHLNEITECLKMTTFKIWWSGELLSPLSSVVRPLTFHILINSSEATGPIWTKLWWNSILKGTHTGTIPARFGLIWFSSFRGEDLNVIFYQNMPNLHNRYKSAERKISQKNSEYMLNYSLPCSCS